MVVPSEETIMKPNIAMVSSSGLGHVTPLLELAKLLVTHHGFHVTFLNITTTESSAALDSLLRSPSIPDGLHVVDLPPVDMSDIIPEGALIVTQISLVSQASLRRSLSSVLAGLENRPRALLIDLFCTDAFDICKLLSIPVYSFVTTSSAFMAFCLYLPALDRDVECEYVDLPGPILIPGCTPVRIDNLLDQVRNRKNDEYKWVLFHFSRLRMAAGLVTNTWEDLEPVPLRAVRENAFFQEIPTPPVYPVGPIIKLDESDTVSNSECLAWLDKQPPDSVLFVALGSGGTVTGEQLTELAFGLEASRQQFLWVVRKPSDASASATYFSAGSDVNDPTSYLPEGFLERTEGVGLVVPSWAPQVAVLGHASTGAFLSHCGWNSSLESLANGVPMIAWPLYAEQRMNAAELAEEVGVLVRPVVEGREGVVGREEVERVVRMVMEGEEGKVMRRKAKDLKDSAGKALGHGGSSRESLSILANEWRAK